MNLIFKNRPRLRYGSGAPSLFVPGQQSLLILSGGKLEQAEIDYILEAEKEKAKERIKVYSENRAILDGLVETAMSMPPGQRAKAIKEMLGRK